MSEELEATDLLGILEDYVPAKDYEASEEEEKLVGSLRRKFEESQRGDRIGLEQRWEISRQYLKGQQLLIRNRTTGDIFRLQQNEQGRLVSVNNVLRYTARALLGKLTRTIPSVNTVPATADVSDMEAAKIADALMQFFTRAQRLDRVYIDWNRDVVDIGTGILKLSWDKQGGLRELRCEDCGNVAKEAEEGQPCPTCQEELDLEYEHEAGMADEERAILAEIGDDPEQVEAPEPREATPLKEGRQGDLKVEVIDTRDFFLDDSATTMDDAQWVCHRTPIAVNEVRRRFPDKAKFISEEHGIFTERHVAFSTSGRHASFETQTLDDSVFLYEFHERPTDEYPKGRVIWMANDMILDQIDNPYHKMERFPFYKAGWEHNKGEFWCEGFIDQAWHQQRELNFLVTQMREHRELTNVPRVLTPHEAGFSADELDNTSGKVYTYNGMAGHEPHFMEMPSMPSYVYQETGRLEGMIRQMASVSEQEAGITNSESSGRYAAILEAQAAQQVGPIIRYNNSEWKELHRGMLILVQEYYTDDRKWTIVGTDGPKTYYFDDINLSPGWDLDIQEDDSLSTNSAVKKQQLLADWSAGLFIDPATGAPDIGRFAKASKSKYLMGSTDVDTSERNRAAALPKAIENGEQHQPKPWDNADIWAEELTNWLRGPGRNATPEVEQQVGQWWTFYAQRTAAAMQQQAMAAQGGMQQGAPPANLTGATTAPPSQSGALADAQNTVGAADQSAEQSARIGPAQES